MANSPACRFNKSQVLLSQTLAKKLFSLGLGFSQKVEWSFIVYISFTAFWLAILNKIQNHLIGCLKQDSILSSVIG